MPPIEIPQGYTPGPWIHDDESSMGSIWAGMSPSGSGARPGKFIAHVVGDSAEAEANAVLIAKAPDMAARIVELEAALAPFVDVLGEGAEGLPDEQKATVTFFRTAHYGLTLGDFRRARSALGEG